MIATATAQRWAPSEVLRVLFAEEAAGRDQASTQARRRASGLPAGKTFDAWDPAASAIPPTQQALRKAVAKLIRADLVLIDDVGRLPVSADAAEALFLMTGQRPAGGG